jgi:tetratricopeptide (TPR) repeat protein
LYIPAHYHLGVAYLSQGRVEEAIEELEMVVETEPDYPQAAENLGVAYNTAGRPEKSIPIFESLLQKEPDNISTLLNLGFSFQDCGLLEKAMDCFQKVILLSEPGSSYAQKAGEAISEIDKQVLDLKE